ncbi:unnamed protein product, partial [Rotaria sp. Silwood1]
MKEKVAVAWRRETKTVGRNPEIVNHFSERIEEEIRTTISKEKITDPKMMKILGNLKKAQKEHKVVFRKTDKSKVFHLGKPEAYIEKSAQYMSKMNAYKEIEQSPLEDMIKNTEELLIDLVRRKLLPAKYLEKLRPSRTESELPHLYYNPKDHKIGEPLPYSERILNNFNLKSKFQLTSIQEELQQKKISEYVPICDPICPSQQKTNPSSHGFTGEWIVILNRAGVGRRELINANELVNGLLKAFPDHSNPYLRV